MGLSHHRAHDAQKEIMIDIQLSQEEIRILGALMEKALTTPDYYPLSLNALKNACNQTTNRDPIFSYDETTVQKALDSLKDQQWVWESKLGRVTKFGENLSKKANLLPRESIILAFLMLKGPQTPGALRSRAERVYAFKNLEEVHEVLVNISEWNLIQQLPRQAGHKELRYTHLFSDPTQNKVNVSPKPEAEINSPVAFDVSKIGQLEADLKQLKSDFEELKIEFLNFKSQF